MTERNGVEIRRILGFVVEESRIQPERFEEVFSDAFPQVLATWFAGEKIEITSESSNSVLEVLLAQSPRASRTGPFWKMPAWRFAIAAAVAGLFITLSWLALSKLKRDEFVVGGPRTSAPGPNQTPVKPEPRLRPEERIVQGVPRPGPDLRIHRQGPLSPLRESGRFAAVVGEPFYRRSLNAPAVRAKSGSALLEGAWVETGDMDRVELKLAGGSTVRLAFNTSIRLLAPGRGIELKSGHAWLTVPKRTSEEFVVIGPTATATVLGTEFGVEARRLREAGRSRLRTDLSVKSGRVEFANENGSVVAKARMKTFAWEGEVPSEPKRVVRLKSIKLTGTHVHTITTQRLQPTEALWRAAIPFYSAGFDFKEVEDGDFRVTRVDQGTSAQRKGLRPGDRIVALGGKKVLDSIEIYRSLYAMRSAAVTGMFQRDGIVREVKLELEPKQTPSTQEPTGWDRAVSSAVWQGILVNRQAGLRRLEEMDSRRKDAAVSNNLGILYELEDQIGRSIRCYREAVRLNPRQPLYRFNLGQALQKIGNFHRSEEELALAVRFGGRGDRVWSEWAEALSLLDRGEEALEITRHGLVRWPRSLPILNRRIVTLLQLHRTDEALELAKQTIEIDPLNAEAWLNLGEVHHDRRDINSAEVALRRAHQLNPAAEPVLINLANVLQELGRGAEAAVLANRLAKLFPDRPAAMSQAGVVLADLDPPKSLRFFRQAILVDPTYAPAYKGLSYLARNRRDFLECVKWALKAIEFDPEDPFNYNLLYIGSAALGRVDQAESALSRALELQPDNWGLHFNMAQLLKSIGKRSRAEAFYRNAMQLNPQELAPVENLARLVHEAGRKGEAETLYRRAIAVSPKSPASHTNLALFLRAEGRLEEAAEACRKSIEQDPNFMDGYNLLSQVYGDLDRPAEVIQTWRSFLGYAPDDQLAQFFLAAYLAEYGESLDEANRLIEGLLKAEPGHPMYRAIGAMIAFRRGLGIDVESTLRDTLAQADPAGEDAAVIHYFLGQVLESKGQLGLAEIAYRRARELSDTYIYKVARALKRIGR